MYSYKQIFKYYPWFACIIIPPILFEFIKWDTKICSLINYWTKKNHPVVETHQPVRSIHESACAQGAGINEPPLLFSLPLRLQPYLLIFLAILNCILKTLKFWLGCALRCYRSWRVSKGIERCFLSGSVEFCLPIWCCYVKFKITVFVSLEGCVLFLLEVCGEGRGWGTVRSCRISAGPCRH